MNLNQAIKIMNKKPNKIQYIDQSCKISGNWLRLYYYDWFSKKSVDLMFNVDDSLRLYYVSIFDHISRKAYNVPAFEKK